MKSGFFILMFCFIGSVSYGGDTPVLQDPPPLPTAHVATPSLADFVASAKAASAQRQETVAATLAQLKIKFPEYFQTALFNYASLSLQKSNRAHPRVILHGDGSTFVGFNGDPALRGYGNLEIIEYKGPQQGYEFHSIHFANEGPSTGVTEDEIAETVGSIQISKANPAVCLRCHGQSRLPIFDAYAVWPGFYGGDDDGLFTYGRAKSNYAPYDGPDLETPAWKAFKKSYAQNDRYKLLGGVLNTGFFHLLPDQSDRINQNFNHLLSNQMSERLMAGLEHNEEALEVLGAVGRCRGNMLPVELYQDNAARLRSLIDIQRSIFALTNGTFSYFSPGMVDLMSGDQLASRMTGYERAFEKYAGRKLRDYSYSRQRDLNLQDGSGGLAAVPVAARRLLKQNFGHDVDFQKCEQILSRIY